MGQGNGSTYQTRENTGSLFRNDRAGNNQNAPQAKGKALIGGRWYWVSAWTKDGRSGKWQSLSFEEMTDDQVRQYANGGGGGQQQGGGGYGNRGGGGGQRQPARQQQRQQPDADPFGDDSDSPF